jgi:hypothetical protein
VRCVDVPFTRPEDLQLDGGGKHPQGSRQLQADD